MFQGPFLPLHREFVVNISCVSKLPVSSLEFRCDGSLQPFETKEKREKRDEENKTEHLRTSADKLGKISPTNEHPDEERPFDSNNPLSNPIKNHSRQSNYSQGKLVKSFFVKFFSGKSFIQASFNRIPH